VHRSHIAVTTPKRLVITTDDTGFFLDQNLSTAGKLSEMRMLNRTFAEKRKDADLEQRIRRDLVFLFDKHGATVSSNTLEAFGNSQITVAVGNLEFQFAKNDRDGEARVMVGPRNGHGVWELLRVALAASTGEDVVCSDLSYLV
jgi:hypothetical protein